MNKKTFKNWQKSLAYAFFGTIVFALMDYIMHLYGWFLPKIDYLPKNYFLYKVIAVPIYLFLAYTFINLKSNQSKLILISGITAFLLQIRYYFIAGYSVGTNITMLIVHFILILIALEIVNYAYKVVRK